MFKETAMPSATLKLLPVLLTSYFGEIAVGFPCTFLQEISLLFAFHRKIKKQISISFSEAKIAFLSWDNRVFKVLNWPMDHSREYLILQMSPSRSDMQEQKNKSKFHNIMKTFPLTGMMTMDILCKLFKTSDIAWALRGLP